jgi:choline kinase
LYVTANPRSVEDGLYLLDRQVSKIAHDRADTNAKRMDKEWLTQLQQSAAKADNRFVIDVDAPELAEDVREELQDRTKVHSHGRLQTV